MDAYHNITHTKHNLVTKCHFYDYMVFPRKALEIDNMVFQQLYEQNFMFTLTLLQLPNLQF